MADVTLGAPVNGTIEIVGPDRAPIDELVGRFLSATHDPHKVIADAGDGAYDRDDVYREVCQRHPDLLRDN